MKILVTGGAGFIGGELLRKLNELGYEDIVIIDKPDLLRTKDTVFSDFIDFTELIHASDFGFLDEIDFCFHLGANSSTRASFKEVYHQNIKFSRNLITECAKRNIPVVFASSGAIYGSNRAKNASPHPLTFYGQSKLVTEKFVTHSGVENIVCLRYHNVYGPTEHHKGDMSSIISKWVNAFFEGKKNNILFEGSDNILRDFIHVDDINKINLLFLDYYLLNQKLPENKIYDVGTGNAVSFQDVANEIINCTGGSIDFVVNPYDETNYQFHTQADVNAVMKIYNEVYHSNYEAMSIGLGIKNVFENIKKHSTEKK